MQSLTPAPIRQLIRDRELATLSTDLRSANIDDLVDLMHELPINEAAVAYRLLHKDDALLVFESLDPDYQADLLNEFGQAEVAEAFGSLDPEDQAWLLDEVPAKVAKRLVASVSSDELDSAMALLGYPQDSVGRRMSPSVERAAPEERVADLLSRLRGQTDDGDLRTRIPVLERDRTLLGMVSLVDLIASDPNTAVGDIMDADPDFAFAEANAELVSRQVLDDGDLLLPVVDREHRLVGLLPIADAARIDRLAVEEDHARAGASEPLRRPYLRTSVFKLARKRVVWLLVLAVSATLTVQVLEVFEATLAEQVVLALFVPLLIGIGGNTGSQASTTVTRALAVGDVRLRDVGKVAAKELSTGLILGLILASVAMTVGSLVYGPAIGIVISLTIALNCPIAATVGGAIPLLARAVRVDPAVFSTPFISTFCDATGLLVYFTVARIVLGL